MGIMRRLEQRATAGSLGPPRDPVLAAWWGGSNSKTGLSVTAETAMKVTAFYRAISLLASTYAALPLGVYRETENGGKELDKNHPLYPILHRQPNRWQTSFEWREMMSGHLSLRGRAYSEIIATGGAAVSEVIPLHPDRVTPFLAPDGHIAFQYRPLQGPSRIILHHEMHYLHGLTLHGAALRYGTRSDGVMPLDPVEAGREALGMAIAIEEHGARLFANGTQLSGLLTMEGHLEDDPARKRLLKSWADAFSGLRNVGKTALLEDGMEWKELGMTSHDAQFIESHGTSVADISRLTGVPLHKLAQLDRSTNNNIEHQGIEWVTDTIYPGCVRREQAMERDLFYGESKKTHSIWFNLNGLQRGDVKARSAGYAIGRQWGYLSTNDIRRLEQLNPVEGGDVYLTPLNMVEAGKETKEILNDNSKT